MTRAPITVVSVNIGEPSDVTLGRHHARSGIDKKPAPGRVAVGPLGLTGDHILSKKHHGGPDQAVYLYSLEDYGAFAEQLGAVPAPGAFGENLTVSGLESATLRIGTRLQFADLQLEITAPRIPCATFAAHMGDAAFVKVFRALRRPGLYARVLGGGTVGAGDTARLQDGPETAPTVGEEFELYYDDAPSRAALERSLAAPIAIRTRQDHEKRLAKLA